MSERNWGLIAAAGLGVVTFSAMGGFVLASQTHSERQQAEASDSAARNKGGRPQQADTDHAGVPALAERIISNPEPGDGTEREKRDLAAQENTAAWAFWILVVSAIQAVLSFVGIMFIVRSLRQGEAALGHAREVSYAELRAYVSAPLGRLVDEAPSVWCCRTEVRNFGQTPAFNVTINYAAYYLPFPVPKPMPELPWDPSPLEPEDIAPTDSSIMWTQGVRKTPERVIEIAHFRACIVTRFLLAYETYSGERIEEPPEYAIFFGRTKKGMTLTPLNETHFEGGYWSKIIEDAERHAHEEGTRKEQEGPKHPEAP